MGPSKLETTSRSIAVDAATFCTLVESCSDLVVITDACGAVKYVNGAADRLLGLDPEALLGTSVFDVLHPGEVGNAIDSLASTITNDTRHGNPMQLRVRAASGTWRCVEVVATNLIDDPNVAGVVLVCRDVSHRDEANRRFREMFEQSPVAQALMVPGERGVIANEAFARLFATSREALLALRGRDLLHVDELRDVEREYDELLSGEEERLVATRSYVRADGSLFHGRVVVSLLRDLDDEIEYVFTTVEDITSEIEAAEALARSEARARVLIERSPDIVAVLYPDGTWEASDQGTLMLGYPKGYDPPGGVFSLIHPDDISSATTALAAVLEGTLPAHEPVELRLRAIDGSFRQFECVAANLNDDPRVGGVMVTARDITARKRAEAKRDEAVRRFKVAFEYAPLVVSIVDMEGRIIDINPAGCALLGRRREDLVGSPAEFVVHPDDRALSIDATMAQLADPTVPVEFRLFNATGDAVTVVSHAALVTPASDTDPPYIITLQTDISERKRLEAELEARATLDPLTGVYNRAALNQHLTHELLQRNGGSELAVMFFDLDNFKTINDTFGHDAGDQLLIYVAERVGQALRRGDLVGRPGGDEFVVSCRVRSGDDALEIGERLRQEIAAGFRYNDQPLHVTASLGIAIAQPDDDVASILRRADTAAYVAKHAGKARTELFQA
jgi:diguanylate cyclase (GGDEF)-like protein/PAS domain S-box-containing protein